MEKDKKSEAFYKRLLGQLQEDTNWPSEYLFKFIVPADLDKIAEVRSIFDDLDADILTRDSTKGNYTSISIKAVLDSPETVVKKYQQVSRVEGVISL